jgi:hypothetical protein
MSNFLWKTKFNNVFNNHSLIVFIVYCVYIVIVMFFEFSTYGSTLVLTSWVIPCMCKTTCIHDWWKKNSFCQICFKFVSTIYLAHICKLFIWLWLKLGLFASKVIIFQETLGVVNAINICYRQQSSYLQARVLNNLTWAIGLVPIETLNHIIHQWLLNRHKKYWLLSNELFVALAMMGMVRKDHAHQTYVIPPLKCGEFDRQINVLYCKMVAKVINMLCPF